MKKQITCACIAFVLALFVRSDTPTDGQAVNCAYRGNISIMSNYTTERYEDLPGHPFKYADVLLNDYNYYMYDEPLLMRYESMQHPNKTDTAVILVHGNSAIPDNWFDYSNYYPNSGGIAVYNLGYDVYAPYITHLSRFQNARRRLASLVGDDPRQLDMDRVAQLAQMLRKDYKTVHMVGISYGGWVVASIPNAVNGKVISIEGYQPIDRWLTDEWLFHWKTEALYPSPQWADVDKTARKVTFLVGSCDLPNWEDFVNRYPETVIYEGAHEFPTETVLDLLR